MTLQEYIVSLSEELLENPKWGDMEVKIYDRLDGSGKHFVSIYTSGDESHVCIDIEE